jgi:hypothetical protein
MSRINVRFVLCLTLICWTAAAVVPASAQHFQQIPGSLTQIAAGQSEVWGLNGSQIYRFTSGTNFYGFAQISGSLTRIAVGGGSAMQPDQVWGISNGYVYQYDFSTNAWNYMGGGIQCKFCLFLNFSQIAVGEGDEDSCHPYEVWGLANLLGGANNVFRYNYCTNSFNQVANPVGNECGGCALASVHVGKNDIWGVDVIGNIWHYELNPINQGYGSQNWALVDGGCYPMQIAVGVNDVWAFSTSSTPPCNGTVYRLDPDGYGPDNTQVGQFASLETQQVAGVTQMAAGGDGVWTILGGSNNVCRFDFRMFGFQCITFVENGPAMTQLAVGSGAGVWLLDSSNQVFTWERP